MPRLSYIWQDRKRTFLGLPLSFTKYSLTEDRLFVDKGFLRTVHDEENLYRVRDVRVIRTLGQKFFGLGTVVVYSTDHSNGETILASIKRPIEVKETIVRLVEDARRRHNIRASEMLMTSDGACDHDGDGIPDALEQQQTF